MKRKREKREDTFWCDFKSTLVKLSEEPRGEVVQKRGVRFVRSD